ncbi:unnamed protein product [Lactuca saligna]|uniref:Bromodomain associated domain-containing protein n=1 Tax=Lactuca saligna TaxID=75948 RepID=A0AA36DWM0_LACSI|nr:unnamed protein product [Lactuca saligna]
MKKKKVKDSSRLSKESDLESSDFNTAVMRIAVAQMCQSVGYQGAQISALKTLTDVAVRYLRALARYSTTSANSTGRTQCNLFDIVRALEELHSNIGFHGNSEPKRRLNILTNSSILRDTMKFVYRSREIPFANPLPRRSPTLPSNPPCFSNQNTKWNHVPSWLPDFPKISDAGEKPIFTASNEGETAWEKKMRTTESNKQISKLPEKRKKISFKIGGGKNEFEMAYGVDLKSGVCKGGKRISCQIYDDDRFSDASSSSKKKLEESSSRTKMNVMFSC